MTAPDPLQRHRQVDHLIRATVQSDERITHALGYGSFTQGRADPFSDLEYWAFLEPEGAPSFDVRAWLETLTPIRHFVVNEFGTPNAVLPGLLRVEFHAVSNSELPSVATWGPEHVFPERMLIKDRHRELATLLQTLVQRSTKPSTELPQVLGRTLNSLAFGLNVLARGERLRALELLTWIRGGVLRLACARSGHTEEWLNPTRLAEQRLPTALLTRAAQLTGPLADLEHAYAEALSWTLELAEQLQLPVSSEFAQELLDLALHDLQTPAQPRSGG